MKKLNKLISKLNKFRTSPIKTLYKFIIFLFLGLIILYKYQIEILKYIVDMKNKFNINDVNNIIDGFKEYLLTLSIDQTFALLHIIFFSIIILSIINILGALFGNEVINYFKLEDRFPRLSIFFKVRGVFQRYYLMWSIFILFSVCIAGICINLLLITV